MTTEKDVKENIAECVDCIKDDIESGEYADEDAVIVAWRIQLGMRFITAGYWTHSTKKTKTTTKTKTTNNSE